MGGSSYAILKALKENDKGVLYSNDLPYLWMDDPLKDQGILVSYELKDRWELFIGDDRDNVPKMISDLGSIDLAHYDSDKAYLSRKRFWESIAPYQSKSCTTIFDDISDNDHFFHLANSLDQSYKVYVVEDQDKLFGVIQNV